MTEMEMLKQTVEGIHRIELKQISIASNVERNTLDLETHIKRTNLLEQKLTKIYAFALISAGFVAAKFGTEILKIMGVLI